MASNQPSQPSAATKFLVHTLYSFGIGILLAVLTAIGQYVSTAGDTIDFKIVASVGGAAFFAYLLSHFNSDIKPNWSQIEQGINDAVSQSVQNAHAPLYNAVGQLQQQVAAVQPVTPQTVAVSTGRGEVYQVLPAQQPLPISQLPTQDMPAVIMPQPWQPTDPTIHWGDSQVMPTVIQP